MTIVYWISTTLSAVALALSAFTYFFHKATIDGIVSLGFPHFFRIELGILQFVAAIVLLIPIFPPQAKEWAYAGAALFYVTAMVAHIAHGDSPAITTVNILLLASIIVSNYTFHRLILG